MAFTRCSKLQDALVATFCVFLLTWKAAARPIPHEQLVTLGDFPDFVALTSNVSSEYFSNDILQQFVHGLGEHYPDYVSVFRIGDSVNGVPILAMDIGASAGDLDEKPYFLWVGNMHGNEPTGRVLLLSLALHLASSKNALVQKVRNRMHTIIIPTMNPDGFKAAERNNAADPDVQPSLPMTGQEEPEVKAVMNLAYSLPITGAASLHEGALVANYPWDGDKDRKKGYAASPDDATFQYLAKSYAQKHTRMGEQIPFEGESPREFFKGGVTNGNDWYPVYNGMQDWLYVARGTRALTLELWNSKWPKEELLPAIWDENRESLLTLSSTAALGGVHGTLRGPGAAQATITSGGLPVHAYAIPHADSTLRRRLQDTLDTSDNSTSAETHDVHAFAASADAVFHLPLAPGKYIITVTAPGANAVEKQVDVPDSGGGVGVHVELTQGDSADAVMGADQQERSGGLPMESFPYQVIAGRGASGVGVSSGSIMQVHPAGGLDSDSSDRDHRQHHSSDSDATSAATTITAATEDSGSAALDKPPIHSSSSSSGGAAAGGDTPVATGGDKGVVEVAEEPPHSTAFFVIRGAMALGGVAFIAAQLLRLRGNWAAVHTAPSRRAHHHQHQQLATNL